MEEFESEFEKIVDGLKIDDGVRDEHKDDLRWRMLAEFNKGHSTDGQARKVLRIILHSRLVRVAAAAMIIVAVLISTDIFNGTTVWAKVLKAFSEVEEAHVIKDTVLDDGTKRRREYWIRCPDLLSEDMYLRRFIDNGRERLTLDKEKKEAQFSNSWMEYRPLSTHYILDELEIFRGVGKKGFTFTKIDSESTKEEIVYSFKYKGTIEFQGKAWVEAETMLPLRMEAELVGEPVKGGIKSGVIIYEYDTIPDDVFSMKIPNGYIELPRKKSGLIEGKILDENGEPVDGVIVHCLDHLGIILREQTITNMQGSFSFNLPPDIPGLPVWLPVFLRAYLADDPSRVAWTVINKPSLHDYDMKPPGKIGYFEQESGCLKTATGIELVMEPAGKITGSVTDIEGVPIEKAQVSVSFGLADKWGNSGVDIRAMAATQQQYGIYRLFVETDEQGRYEITNLPRCWDKSEYNLSATADNYVRRDTSFKIKDYLEHEEVNFELYTAGITVRGVLVDNYGAVLGQRTIYVKAGGVKFWSCGTKTDKDGRFTLIGCPVSEDLEIIAELNQNSYDWDKAKQYVYYPETSARIDYAEGKSEYEVRLVAEKPEIVLNVEVRNTAGQLLPLFPVEIRSDPGLMSSQWKADKNFKKRTDMNGTCRFTDVPDIKGLRVVLYGDNRPWNEKLTEEEKAIAEEHAKKYFWAEVPVEVVEGMKEYDIAAVAFTQEEYYKRKKQAGQE